VTPLDAEQVPEQIPQWLEAFLELRDDLAEGWRAPKFFHFYTRDFRLDTGSLDSRSVGVYIKILIAMWEREKKCGSWPSDEIAIRREFCHELDDDPELSDVEALRRTRIWEHLWSRLKGYFFEFEGFIYQKRLCEEWMAVETVRRTKQQAGRRGGRPPKASNQAPGQVAIPMPLPQPAAPPPAAIAGPPAEATQASPAKRKPAKPKIDGAGQYRLDGAKPAPPPEEEEPEGTAEFLRLYPSGHRGDRQRVVKLLRELTLAPRTATEAKGRVSGPPVPISSILDGLAPWIAKWRADGWKFILGAERWLQERKWEDPPLPQFNGPPPPLAPVASSVAISEQRRLEAAARLQRQKDEIAARQQQNRGAP
jgi:uncharacterized protein YdaU (DUF1376 family)